MIIISVYKNNQITNQASFENQLDADIWLNQELENKSFGEPGSFEIKVEYS
jgi:hypothetical protein